MALVTRAYNRFEIDTHKAIITKYSKKPRLRNEIEHYKAIPASLGLYFPKFISSTFDKEKEEHSLCLELCGYENLGNKLIEEVWDNRSSQEWKAIAFQIRYILQEFSRHRRSQAFKGNFRDMYENKTFTEYVKLISNFSRFTELARHKDLVIDGKRYKNFEYIWDDIEKLLETFYENIETNFFHGDLCFSNILYGFLPGDDPKVVLKLIDMRGKFGNDKGFGDPYYDLAKLMHSTDVGYEYFIYDKFSVVDKDTAFEINYEKSHEILNKTLVDSIFTDVLYSEYDIRRIKTIQGLIYIGMCARHYDNSQRQLAMYLSGVKILNEVLEG
jgi:hypothetical protein